MITKEQNEFILSYFRKLDLKPSRTYNRFYDDLAAVSGKEIANEIRQILQERGEGSFSSKLYELKNNDLALSLKFAAYSADLYRKYFEWLITSNLKPKSILDIGCDNGIVACFYAFLFPEAQIVGIDSCSQGIECAEQLALKLQCNNVTFKQINLLNIPAEFYKEKYDLISSIRSLGEIVSTKLIEKTAYCFWSFRDYKPSEPSALETSVLKSIKELLSPSGNFITWERLGFESLLLDYIHKLQVLGFSIDPDLSDFISFEEIGNKQRMPVFVTKALKDGEETDPYKILFQLFSNNKFSDLDQDMQAEFAFESLDKELKYGLHIYYTNGTGEMKAELWKSNEDYYLYTFSDQGYRKIENVQTDSVEPVISGLQEFKEKHIAQGNKVREYSTITERFK